MYATVHCRATEEEDDGDGAGKVEKGNDLDLACRFFVSFLEYRACIFWVACSVTIYVL